MMDRAEFFRDRVPKYRKNPVLFFIEVLQFYPDDWQADVAVDIAGNPRVTVRSGQGVGKTGLEAALALWFLCCFPYARVVATAPTMRQLHDVLWSEIAKWRSKSPLLKEILKWTKTYVQVIGAEDRWFAVARTANRPENMQGFHEDNMLFLVDEASGVRDDVMEAIRGTLSGSNNKLAMFGNPTKASGFFYESHTAERANFIVHKVSSREVERTNKENIQALEDYYGPESNVVRVRVDGEFPKAEDDVFIPLELVEASVMTELASPTAKICFGVDVARFGDDETVIAKNEGGAITIPVVRHGQDLMRTAGDVCRLCNDYIADHPQFTGVITVVVDDTGLGGGVTDRLNELIKERKLKRTRIVPVNFASAAPDVTVSGGGSNKPRKAKELFGDIVTYAWYLVRDQMKKESIALANDNQTVAQLSSRKYYMMSDGRLKLESKKEMKDRIGKSPDRADAVMLSCYLDKGSIVLPIGLSDGLLQESTWNNL